MDPGGPDDPLTAIDAFLAAHAGAQALAAGLYARGEALLARLDGAPPADPRWGRFLVALGELAAERLGDDQAARRHFQRALADAARHGDGEAAVAAGYDLGVLQHRAGGPAAARRTWSAAARDGLRQGCISAATVRAALAALDGALEPGAEPDADQRALAKQAWLAWLWLGHRQPERQEADLRPGILRSLALLLLPADPLQLAYRWRTWAPALIPVPAGAWRDGDPACLRGLFALAADAAALLPAGESGCAAYRQLAAASARG